MLPIIKVENLSNKVVILSYPLDNNTPAYGGGESIKIEQDKSMHKGASCNTQKIHLPNHIGTHIDCPSHFSIAGKTLTDYAPDFWICKQIEVLVAPSDIPNRTQINADYMQSLLSNRMNLDTEAEILILKTGWCSKRNTPEYIWDPPGIQKDTAILLRKVFPNLRFLGFDLISVSSYSNREAGRESHREFLANSPEILLIEDMDLSKVDTKTKFSTILVSPFLLKDADGAPVTVWGFEE